MIELSNVEMSFWIWTGMPVDRNRRDGEMEMVTVHLLTIRCCVLFFYEKVTEEEIISWIYLSL